MCRIFYNLYMIKNFGKFPFNVIIYINELFIFEPLVYKFMKKIFFISSNEWNLRKLTIKKKKDQHTSYTAKSTRGTVIIFTKCYFPPAPFLKINLSLHGNVRTEYIVSCLSTNDVLPLCKVSRQSIKQLKRHGRIHWGCRGVPDNLLNLAIIWITLEKNLDPPIIGISVAIAVKS